jgi:hypothetical protein
LSFLYFWRLSPLVTPIEFAGADFEGKKSHT